MMDMKYKMLERNDGMESPDENSVLAKNLEESVLIIRNMDEDFYKKSVQSIAELI
jgi:hypothetical protein